MVFDMSELLYVNFREGLAGTPSSGHNEILNKFYAADQKELKIVQ